MEALVAQSSDQSHQAVCYKCSYVGLGDHSGHHCPLCGFLLIYEARDLGAQQSATVHDVLDRSKVEVAGAPSLPGVHPSDDEKTTVVIEKQVPVQQARPLLPLPEPGAPTSRLRPGLTITLALAGALVAGLVAAVLVHGF